MLGTTFIKRFETYCPQSLAEKGDPVGLHIGTLAKEVKKIMITLDVRPEVVAEAIASQVDLIIAKHPIMFVPAQRLTADNPQTKMYLDLIAADIAVYCAHTNLDIIENGLNDWFCEVLGVKETTFLEKTHEISYEKLITFVSEKNAEEVRLALKKAGAGEIGNYQGCSFQSGGTGYFTPNEKAQPTLGENLVESAIHEAKLEVVYPKNLQEAVLTALFASHPYEEVAYDIFKTSALKKEYGLGRIGQLDQPTTLKDFALKVKKTFNVPDLRVIAENLDQKVQRVAICGGSGQKFYPTAKAKGADVYITGDVYYHTGHDMLADEMPVIDPGHYIEYYCKEKLQELFISWQQEEDWDVEFVVSKINTNPFTIL